MDIYLVTGNKHKLREAEAILGIRLLNEAIDLDELQELDPIKIADHKVDQAFGLLKKPVFVMDQSVYIDCLNSFPGPLIKWFWERVTLEKICQIAKSFDNYAIVSETLVTYFDGKERKYFRGTIEGTIPELPRGRLGWGWGWDPIFIPKRFQLTYGEMNVDKVLNVRSHTQALRELRDYLYTKEK